MFNKEPVSEQDNEVQGAGNDEGTHLIPEKTKESFNHFPGRSLSRSSHESSLKTDMVLVSTGLGEHDKLMIY
jgi:hypothetical protein